MGALLALGALALVAVANDGGSIEDRPISRITIELSDRNEFESEPAWQASSKPPQPSPLLLFPPIQCPPGSAPSVPPS